MIEGSKTMAESLQKLLGNLNDDEIGIIFIEVLEEVTKKGSTI